MTTKRWLIALYVTTMWPASLLHSREWKSADGSKTFSGDLRDYNPPIVTVANMQNGSLQTFNEKVLSVEDREYCRDSSPLLKKILRNSIIGLFGIEKLDRSEQISQSDKNAMWEKYRQRSFRVTQIFADGALCTENPLNMGVYANEYFGDYEYERIRRAIQERNSSSNRDFYMQKETLLREQQGHPFETFWLYIPADSVNLAVGEDHQFDLYWAGTETFAVKDGTNFTVRAFATSMETALRVLNKSTSGKTSSKTDESNAGSGSCFAISSKGHLVTNAHVIKNTRSLMVRYNGNELVAKVLAVDGVNDLAILKIEADTTPLPFEANAIKMGDEILAVGFPNPDMQGSTVKITRGIISSMKGVRDDARYFQIDAAIQPGNSGGPLINLDGKIVGIIASKLNEIAVLEKTGSMSQNVNYAIKLDYLLPLIKTVDGLNEIIKAEPPTSSDKTAGEKGSSSTFLLMVQ